MTIFAFLLFFGNCYFTISFELIFSLMLSPGTCQSCKTMDLHLAVVYAAGLPSSRHQFCSRESQTALQLGICVTISIVIGDG